MRRLLILPLALLAAALAPVVPAGADTPAACTVQLPTKIAAAAPVTWVYPTFTGCDTVTHARWYLFDASMTRRGGAIGIENGKSTAPWLFRDTYPTGRYTARAIPPATPTGTTQNSTSTVVKFATRLTIKAHRQDRLRVPLSGTVIRYVAAVNGFRRWPHRMIAIDYRDCTTCTWHFLSFDKTDANGVYSLGAVSEEVRYYRARISNTATFWGGTSASVNY